MEILISECFILSLAFLREIRQSISRNISFSLSIIDLEVISRELLGLADLTRAQVFYIYELAKVIMVSKNKELILATFPVVALSLKCFKNSQELLIVGFVPSLSGDHLLRKKNYSISLTNFRLRRNWI